MKSEGAKFGSLLRRIFSSRFMYEMENKQLIRLLVNIILVITDFFCNFGFAGRLRRTQGQPPAGGGQASWSALIAGAIVIRETMARHLHSSTLLVIDCQGEGYWP
jgi:hypothetical protein